MSDLALKIINMSLNAGIVVVAVLILRLFTGKLPKFLNVLLWGAVALRIMLPFSFESEMSLMPAKEVITSVETVTGTQEIKTEVEVITETESGIVTPPQAEVKPETQPSVEQTVPNADAGIPEADGTANEHIIETTTKTNIKSNSADVMLIVGIIWAAGVAGMIIYAVISYIKIKRTVRISVCKEKNIYYCDNIRSPFILGIIKPKIYLPSDIDEEDEKYVLMHENAHLKRKDYLWKPFGFLLLSVHWFNPLIWVAYIMLCRDIEVACDEKAVKNMSKQEKIGYSKSLVNCSINQKSVSVNPLTFGGISVKKRIENILNYKKAPLWAMIIAVLLSCVLLVGFMTDPVDKTGKKDNKEKVETVVSKDDDANDTSSEPTTTEPGTEKEPTESKPEDTSSEQQPSEDTTSKPINDLASKRKVIFDKLSPKQSEEVRNQVVDWILSDSKPSEKKLYTDAEIAKMRTECDSYDIEPDLIFVTLTEKASKELFFDEFTPSHFPNIDCKKVEISDIERNAVVMGKTNIGEKTYSYLPNGQVVEEQENDYIIDKFEGKKLSIKIYVNEQTKENVIENMIELQKMDIVEEVGLNYHRYLD